MCDSLCDRRFCKAIGERKEGFFEQARLCDSLCDTPFSEIVASEAPERFPGTITQILVHSA